MRETTKANMRRKNEDIQSTNWLEIFQGNAIDLGPGDDPLRSDDWGNLANVIPFDQAQGDARKLPDYFPENHFDLIHASQILEDFENIQEALTGWTKCLKPGGYMIITVPDFVLYEQLQWPPRYNEGHKATFSLDLPASPAGDNHWHLNGEKWNNLLESLGLKTRILRLVDTNYDYSKLGSREDQTLGNAEAFIEIVLYKPRPGVVTEDIGLTSEDLMAGEPPKDVKEQLQGQDLTTETPGLVARDAGLEDIIEGEITFAYPEAEETLDTPEEQQ